MLHRFVLSLVGLLWMTYILQDFFFLMETMMYSFTIIIMFTNHLLPSLLYTKVRERELSFFTKGLYSN